MPTATGGSICSSGTTSTTRSTCTCPAFTRRVPRTIACRRCTARSPAASTATAATARSTMQRPPPAWRASSDRRSAWRPPTSTGTDGSTSSSPTISGRISSGSTGVTAGSATWRRCGGVALGEAGEAKADMGVDFGDFDNDGDEDLFVTELTSQGSTLYVNDGAGLFTERSAGAGIRHPSLPYTGFGAGWLDFDNDGWLDLLAVNGLVVESLDRAASGALLPLDQRNQLFRNRGNGGFEDVSAEAGAVFRLSEVSRGTAFGDIDNDGDTDVLVANAAGPPRLLVNGIGQDRHWVGLRLAGVGGRDMVGARVARDPVGRHDAVAPGSRGWQLCVGQRPAGARRSRLAGGSRRRACHLAGRAGRGMARPAGGSLYDPHRGEWTMRAGFRFAGSLAAVLVRQPVDRRVRRPGRPGGGGRAGRDGPGCRGAAGHRCVAAGRAARSVATRGAGRGAGSHAVPARSGRAGRRRLDRRDRRCLRRPRTGADGGRVLRRGGAQLPPRGSAFAARSALALLPRTPAQDDGGARGGRRGVRTRALAAALGRPDARLARARPVSTKDGPSWPSGSSARPPRSTRGRRPHSSARAARPWTGATSSARRRIWSRRSPPRRRRRACTTRWRWPTGRWARSSWPRRIWPGGATWSRRCRIR